MSYALGLALASFNSLNALWPLKLQTQHWNCCVTKLTVSFFFLWLQLGQVKTADCSPLAPLEDLLGPKTDSNKC